MHIIKNLENPPSEYRAHPFWSWNDKLDPDELRRQIREMKRVGLGGYFMHARGGLLTEYLSEDWFECIKAGVDEGKKQGLRAWSYDENGWPSGFGGGIVTAMGDRYHVRWLICRLYNGKKPEGKVLGFYGDNGSSVRFLGEKIREAKASATPEEVIYYVSHDKNPCYVDLMNPKAVRAFIDCTYEVYKEKLGGEFGVTMPGFFTDEPQYSSKGIPWSYVLPSEFEKSSGYDLTERLPLLFLDREGSAKLRFDFWRVVSRLYTESFGKQLYDWCEENGCMLTGHAMAEESLYSQMKYTAGVMPLYEYMHIPGIDKLCRSADEYSTAAKQLGSAAKQLGKKHIMTETFAGCGWDVSFEELKWIAEWQYVCGVNFMCQHLESYSIRGLRKRDWPPSMFYQSAWWDEYKRFNDYFARLGRLLADSKEEAHVLLLHPMHTAYAVYNGVSNSRVSFYDREWISSMRLLADNHIGYHLGDETIIGKYGSVDNNMLSVGNCRYSFVILPSMLTLDRAVFDLLSQLMASGGRVFSLGEKPTLLDGEESAELSELMSRVPVIPGLNPGFGSDAYGNPAAKDPEMTIRMLSSLGIKKISVTDRDGEIGRIRMSVSILEDGTRAYFFQNQDKDRGYDAKITLDTNLDAVRLSLEELSVSIPNIFRQDGRTVIYLHFEPMQSHIILSGKELPEVTEIPQPSFTLPLGNTWQIERCDDNALTLDRCEYSTDGGETWEGPVYILDLMERLIGKRFCDRLSLRFCFEISEGTDISAMKRLYLASELTDDFEISVNRHRLQSIAGEWWLDRAIRVYDLKEYAQHGMNIIRVDGSFYQSENVYRVLFGKDILETERNKLTYDTELESLYIVGDFGVFSKTPFVDSIRRSLYTEGGFYISDRPTEIIGGNILTQGYTFFRGRITLTQDVEIRESYGERVSLRIPRPYAALVNLYVNGKFVKCMPWADYSADITDFVESGKTAKISLEAVISNRNLLGPHYSPMGEQYSVSPRAFAPHGNYSSDNWRYDRYCFVKAGLGE